MSESNDTNSHLGYYSKIPPRMGVNVPRIEKELLDRFADANVSDISDIVGRLYTMNLSIKPMYTPMRRLIGQALTAKVHPGDNFTIHGALSVTQPGDILVVDWLGYTGGCGAGGLACRNPVSKGLAGIVIDGCWRDIEEVRALDLPIFAKAVNPFSPTKSQIGEINVPVCCGGVIVEAGDVVVGDEQGVVVIPRTEVHNVAYALKGHDAGVKAGTLAALYRADFDSRSGQEIDLSDRP